MSELLLIDPDAHRRAELASRLVGRGFAVRSVGTVREAELAIARRRPDGIVIDAGVAETSHEVLERVCASGPIRIVALVREPSDARATPRVTITYSSMDLDTLVAALVELFAPSPRAPALDFASELAELRRTFSSKLPARLAELTAAIDAAKVDDAKLDAARAIAHRLRGAAGSYGHASFGEAVTRIDELLAGVPDWDEITRAVASATASLATGGPR